MLDPYLRGRTETSNNHLVTVPYDEAAPYRFAFQTSFATTKLLASRTLSNGENRPGKNEPVQLVSPYCIASYAETLGLLETITEACSRE